MANMLDEIKDALTKISKWPWTAYTRFGGINEIHDMQGNEVVRWQGFDGVNGGARSARVNAMFIASTPQSIAALVAYAEASEGFWNNVGHEPSEGIWWDKLQQARAALGLASAPGGGGCE
jgi:hypothetical protein